MRLALPCCLGRCGSDATEVPRSLGNYMALRSRTNRRARDERDRLNVRYLQVLG